VKKKAAEDTHTHTHTQTTAGPPAPAGGGGGPLTDHQHNLPSSPSTNTNTHTKTNTHTHTRTRTPRVSIKDLQKEIQHVLATTILKIINTGTHTQLLSLHGIGKKRAELILERRRGCVCVCVSMEECEGGERCVAFRSLEDLKEINMKEKAIQSLLQLNTLERLQELGCE
jgi:hypothetical protein